MKKMLLLTVAALLVFAVMASSASAQNISYAVGVQIKNLDPDNAAQVTVTYYNQDGSVEGSFNTPTIPAGEDFTMATLQGVESGFNGSAVISSDRAIAAIANVFGNGQMGASYTAFAGGAPTTSLPLIMRNHFGFDTWFNVQNTGNANTTVTVTYSPSNATETATIAPGAAKTFNQRGNTNLPDPAGNAGYVGSATVASTGGVPIVATLMQQGPTTLLGYDGFLPTNASTNPVMPLVNANNFGFITGIQIQNNGSQSTSVTVSYTASQAGASCTETQTIPGNGASATFAEGAFRTSNSGETCANGARFIGSARVTANSTSQPLVAIANQLNSPAQKGAAYGAFNPANATSIVELPLIMDRNFGYWTGYSIMNVGTTATTVTCTYTGSSRTDSDTVQPGGALTVQNINQLANGYVGAATCSAGAGGQIVGVVNELGNNSSSDSFLVYEGTNR